MSETMLRLEGLRKAYNKGKPGEVTVLRGAQTFPFLVTAADRLAGELAHAELVVVPESIMHRPDPAATARVVRDRFPDRDSR